MRTWACTATFLGGSIPVNSNACVCDEGWSGPLCQYNDSQNGVPKIEPTYLPTRQPTIHPTLILILILPPSQSPSKLTAAVHSVLKQSGTLLLVMKVWVAVTLVVVEFRGFSLTMGTVPMRHARLCRSSFRLVRAEFVACFIKECDGQNGSRLGDLEIR